MNVKLLCRLNGVFPLKALDYVEVEENDGNVVITSRFLLLQRFQEIFI
jgi:hypothetical protein